MSYRLSFLAAEASVTGPFLVKDIYRSSPFFVILIKIIFRLSMQNLKLQKYVYSSYSKILSLAVAPMKRDISKM